MARVGFCAIVLCMVVAGCTADSAIVRIVDFELSPDEDKIAFSAITPVGNTDIWVVEIDGTGLRKLTFKDRSPSNHIARFFKKHKWRNFFEIDPRFPNWTKDGKIVFCQKLTKHDMRGQHTVSLRYWTINSDGTDIRQKTDKDEVIRRGSFGPVNRYKISERSEKYKKKIFLKGDTLWVLNYGDTTPKRLIQ